MLTLLVVLVLVLFVVSLLGLAFSHLPIATPATTRGRYCYGTREQIRRHRQIVQGRIRVGYVPCLKFRQATGIKWTEV